MVNVQWSIILVALLLALPLSTVPAQKKLKDKVIAYMDSSNVKGTDPKYIGLSKKPWAVTLNSTFEQLRLTMRSDYHQRDADYDISYDTYMKILPRVSSSLGLWVGYRGFGFGYGLSLSGNDGMDLTINMVTPSYGLNVRFDRFYYNNPVFGINNFIVNGRTASDDFFESREYSLKNSMKITSLIVDGFWIFNKRKFSYSAAYDQSTRQLRSAGSFIAGMMFYFQKYDLRLDPSSDWYSDANENITFLTSNDIDKFKVYQGSIGAGYSYNWVPRRNWVVNVTAMPMITIVNKLSVHQLDLRFVNDGDPDREDIQLIDKGGKTDNGGLRLNLDLQLAVVYWHKDWFFKVTGQAHHFRGTYDLITTKFFDWNAKASVGYTF